MRYGYRGYGLTLVSEIELPEYLPRLVTSEPDITISHGQDALEAWEENAGTANIFTQALRGGHLLRVPGVAVYHVIEGREIRITADLGADPGMVRLFTIGSAMGMALHQRGILVLHGATVARGGQARILVGDSGAGKSTLAARLGRAGCSVLGDDTMALWSAPDGGAGKWLWQGSRVFKLWQDSVAAMGIGLEELTPLGNRADKYYVPNPDPAASNSTALDTGVELAEILVLETGDGPPRIEPLEGIRALQAVAANTYRPEYVAILGRESEHFHQCGELTRDIRVVRLIRPWGLAAIDETLELIMSRWEAGHAFQDAR
jgi:hypothetical protein